MNNEWFISFLGWCTLLNYAVLIFWFIALVLAKPSVKRVHGAFFQLSDEAFDAIHYGGLGLYKLLIFIFNLVPFLVLLLLSH